MVIAFDLDGTLASGPFDKAGPRPHMVKMARILSRLGYKIIVVTARPESFRPRVEGWLEKASVPYSTLRMRPDGDNRPDDQLRADQTLDASILFDDKPDNCGATRAKCVLV